ncbi:MAG: zinc-binding dehydrogenase, partial [bacterium]
GMDQRESRVRCAHELGLGAFIADEHADERIRDLTLGGPEVVIEASGRHDAIDRAGSIARIGGRVVMVANYHAPTEIQPGHWLNRGISLLPSIAYTPEHFDVALKMVGAGSIDVAKGVTSVHRLEEVNQAFASFGTQSDQIKLLIDPSS